MKGSQTILFGLAAVACLGENASAFDLQKPQSASIKHAEPTSRRNFFQAASIFSAASLLAPGRSVASEVGGKIQFGDESIMSQKQHGTSAKPVQNDLLYGVSNKLADKICNFNRHFAENGGYFTSTSFEDAVLEAKGPITFYDSVTGKPLFVAPKKRSPEDFIRESEIHGWPSFRDEEVSDFFRYFSFKVFVRRSVILNWVLHLCRLCGRMLGS